MGDGARGEIDQTNDIDGDRDLRRHVEPHCGCARRCSAEEFVVNHKVVVLTEGSTDKLGRQRRFRLLYPHLSDYDSFMDINGRRREYRAVLRIGRATGGRWNPHSRAMAWLRGHPGPVSGRNPQQIQTPRGSFARSLKIAGGTRLAVERSDWTGRRAIIELIRVAFHE